MAINRSETAKRPLFFREHWYSADSWSLLFAAWLTATAASLGALFIGEVMGQTPCLLCWYQRAFMFPLAVILSVACYTSDIKVWRYALPLAAIGWLITLYHNMIYFRVISERLTPCQTGVSCSGADMAILGGLPIPLLSLAAFSVLTFFFIVLSRRSTQ